MFGLSCVGGARAQEPNNPPPTFTKDVAPILQKHCQTCHRPGEAAPFSMLSYEETRPWAPMIKMVVTKKNYAALVCRPSIRTFRKRTIIDLG
jgi:hypothetical protein